MSITDQTIAVVLAADRGESLSPLTRERSKAAIPFGGEYRLVDFCLSNCLHSGLRRVLVLTQFNSHSLNKHLRDGWSVFNPELGEYITAVPPQGRDGAAGYRGSADALCQNLYLLERSGATHVLVLPGDHVYRMDYAAVLEAHDASGSDVTVACATQRRGASARPNVEVGKSGRVLDLQAQPAGPANRSGRSADNVMVPMGIYAFRTRRLIPLLRDHVGRGGLDWDLDADVLPSLVGEGRVNAYPFGGSQGRVSQDRYWSDVADIDAYFQANMALLEPSPGLDLYQDNWSIWSYSGKNPPARTVSSASGNEGIFVNSVVSNGTVNEGAAVSNSVVCPRVRVEDSATVERCILYARCQVGHGAQLRGCIVDKGVHVRPGDRIGFDHEQDRARFVVTRGGVVVVQAAD